MRACTETPVSWRDLLRIRLRPFLAYVYVALLIEMALVMTFFTVIAIPLLIFIAGVAAAAEGLPAGMVAPLRALAPYLHHGRVVAGLLFVFVAGTFVALLNVWFLFQVIVWAAGSLPGFDAVRWQMAMAGGHPRILLVLYAVTLTIVEPFWLAAMHVYADRVRSRESGEDLRRRFLEVIAARTRRLEGSAAALAIAVLMAGSPVFAQEGASLQRYVDSLQQIRDDLSALRLDEAAARARSWQNVSQVAAPQGTFQPDRSLLDAVTQVPSNPHTAGAVFQRVSVTVEALRERAPELPPARADTRLLDELRSAEQVDALWRGGEVFNVPSKNPGVFEELGRMVRKAVSWLAKKLGRFGDWLSSLRPQRKDREERQFLGVPTVVWIVTLFVVMTMLLLALYVLRRSRGKTAAVASSQARPMVSRDEDPLSRESDEWEKYAAELEATGRLREAIRAWYHAVLVSLYRAGILHYRRGLTNWEYVRSLSPSLGWRPHFISMTRRFEQEWYGHRPENREALDETVLNAKMILTSLRESER